MTAKNDVRVYPKNFQGLLSCHVQATEHDGYQADDVSQYTHVTEPIKVYSPSAA